MGVNSSEKPNEITDQSTDIFPVFPLSTIEVKPNLHLNTLVKIQINCHLGDIAIALSH